MLIVLAHDVEGRFVLAIDKTEQKSAQIKKKCGSLHFSPLNSWKVNTHTQLKSHEPKHPKPPALALTA